MKKILSVVLAFVLVLSLMPVSTTFAVASDLYYQNTFDEQTTGQKGTGRTPPAGIVSSASNNTEYHVIADDYGTTGNSMQMKTNARYSRNYFSAYSAETISAGEVYEMSARVKATLYWPEGTLPQTGKIRIGNFDLNDKNNSGSLNGTHRNDGGSDYELAIADGWKNFKGSMTIASSYEKLTPAVSSNQSSSAYIRDYAVDDVHVAKKYRAYFDDVTSTSFSVSGATAQGGTADFDTEVNHIKEEGAKHANSVLHSERTALSDKVVFAKPLVNFDKSKGKPYTFEAWVKVNSASVVDSGKVVLAVVDNSKADKYTTSEEFDVNKEGWTKLSLDYIMPEVGGDVIAPTGLCVMQKSGDIITDLNIDDVTILPIGTKAIFDTEEFVHENISVTGGAAFDISTDYYNRASGRSLKVFGRTSLEDMICLNNPLSDEEYEYKKPYTIKMSVMSPATGTVVPFAVLESGVVYGDEVALGNRYWKDAELTFLADSKPTSIGVMQKTGEVLSTVYVDDISIAQSKYLDEKYVINTSVDEAGNVNISGKLIPEMSGYPITVKVLKADKTIDDMNTEAAILAKDTAVVVDYDGSYSASLDCTSTLDVNSELTVVVDGLIYPETSFLYDKINYTNPVAEDRILASANGASTGAALKEILTSGSVYDDIGLSAIELPEIVNVDFIYDYVVGLGVDFADSVELAAAYEMGWMLGYLNESTDTETMEELIYAYEEKLGLPEEKTYEEVFDLLEAEDKTEIINKMTTAPAEDGVKFANEEAVVKFILDETVMFKVDEGINYSAKMDALIANAEYLGVDFAKYNDLKSAGKKYVGTRLAEDIESISDFAEIQDLLDEYIEEYKEEAEKEEKRGGGGGGSSSGGGNKYVNAKVEIPSGTPIAPQAGNAGSNTAGSTSGGFSDVASGHWAEESIKKLRDKNVISGYEDGSFKPEKKVTRAEYVKMIISMFNLVDNNAEANFSDVSKADWSYKYIASAEKLGIISGGGNGGFDPNGEITREDLVTISYRLFGAIGMELPQINEKVYFVDRTEISPYAEDAAIALQRAGIVNGVATDNADEFNFNPKHSASRAECAKILAGLLGYDW